MSQADELKLRDFNLDEGRPHRLKPSDTFFTSAHHLRIGMFKPWSVDAEMDATQVLSIKALEVKRRLTSCLWVCWVNTCHQRIGGRRVFRRRGYRTQVGDTPTERGSTMLTDATKGRLESNGTAERRGDAYRATSIGP